MVLGRAGNLPSLTWASDKLQYKLQYIKLLNESVSHKKFAQWLSQQPKQSKRQTLQLIIIIIIHSQKDAKSITTTT